jgi:hypothetical protein
MTGKIITPQDLYDQPTEFETNNLNEMFSSSNTHTEINGCYYNHMPEVSSDQLERQFDSAALCLKLKVHQFFDFDGRRYWCLSSLWHLGTPFMIMQNAGREGDDHAKRYITDIKTYNRAHNYVNNRRIYVEVAESESDIVNPTEPLGNKLTTFYGNTLGGYFERY